MAEGKLALALSPAGRPYLREAREGEAPLEGPHAGAIAAAFDRGPGEGVLHLGAVEIGTVLPPAFAYLRDLGHELVARASVHPDLETLRDRLRVEAPREHLEAMAGAAPPMTGAEYVTADVLASLWESASSALAHELAAWKGTAAEWLGEKNGAWATVGRVCFHLAENKKDPDAPFAFLATYTTRLSSRGAAQHRPLGHALTEHAGAGEKAKLLSLLLPVQRAAEKSAVVRKLADDGDVYHPLAWSPREAHDFLQDVPAIEAAGVMVRVPDWWTSRRARAEVKVAVGARAPSQLGAEAVLDFSATLALGGEPLTAEEQRAILSATAGLVLVKGRWIEADAERLRQALDHWKSVERASARDGVSFHEAMRMVTGSTLEGDAAGAVPEAAAPWSRVEPGPWMKGVLDGLRAPEALAPIDPGGELRATLRPYQRAGVQWLHWAHGLGLGVCLADDMGLGKTLQVLALLVLRKSLAKAGPAAPALLVVPASLVANWKAEASRFTPGLDVQIAHGGSAPSDVSGADAVVTTYGTLGRAAWIREREWGLVVLDEAQAIKNPAAKQTRTVKALRARSRLALTGTPVENRLGDLWSLFDFLSPGLLGTAKQFGAATKRMAKQEGWAPLRRLVGPYVLRRMKTDKRVIADLPDKTEVVAFSVLTKVQAALYAQAVEDLARTLASEDGMKRRGAVLASLLRFKQICNHPSHWLGDGRWEPSASGKVVRLAEICEPIAARQEKALVFTQFREMTAPLAAFLEGIFGREGLVLHGSVPVKERKALVDRFQDDAGPPFFVLSLKAGGTGLNLTAASHVIHFDRWWNPAVENQATDRAFRIGQKRSVLVHKLVCRGTVEERIDALLESKRGLADAVVGEAGGEIALTEISNEELLRLVSLDLAAAMGEEA
jgi:non-specific serine/threonine protein kinase